MHYRLVAAVESDEAWLEMLRRDVYRELFQATWGGWDEERHLRHFSECIDQGHISIMQADDERIGMIQLFEESHAVIVGEIQVQSSDQNRGVGTRVLRDVIAAAHSRRKSVRLSVALKNDRAFRLYERLGFRPTGRSDTHNHMECAPCT